MWRGEEDIGVGGAGKVKGGPGGGGRKEEEELGGRGEGTV